MYFVWEIICYRGKKRWSETDLSHLLGPEENGACPWTLQILQTQISFLASTIWVRILNCNLKSLRPEIILKYPAECRPHQTGRLRWSQGRRLTERESRGPSKTFPRRMLWRDESPTVRVWVEGATWDKVGNQSWGDADPARGTRAILEAGWSFHSRRRESPQTHSWKSRPSTLVMSKGRETSQGPLGS